MAQQQVFGTKMIAMSCRFGCGAFILLNGQKINDNDGKCTESKKGTHQYQTEEVQKAWAQNKTKRNGHRYPTNITQHTHSSNTNQLFFLAIYLLFGLHF